MQPATSEVKIRDASKNDAENITEVLSAAYSPLRSIYRPTNAASDFRVEQQSEGTCLVAIKDDQVVGTVECISERDCIHLFKLAVHPNYQRLGIARLLIDVIVNRALSSGLCRLTLNTIEETGNVSLFQKLGFRVVRNEIASWCQSDLYSEVHDVKMERNIA